MSREAFDEMAAEPTPALIARMRAFESDHAPGGWPCIRMRDITALCDAIEAARAAALEEAAEIADSHATCEGIGQCIAAEIRALKETE